MRNILPDRLYPLNCFIDLISGIEGHFTILCWRWLEVFRNGGYIFEC